MKVTGLAVGFVDVRQPRTKDFNTWYDYDHIPENLALPEVIGAQRYVATADLKALRAPSQLEALADDRGTYFTAYKFGTDDLAKAAESWSALGSEMRDQDRMFLRSRVSYTGVYRLDYIRGRDDIPVRREALPFVAHRAVMVVLTRVPDPAWRDQVNEWFHDTHAVDLLGVPGIAVAMRLSRVGEEGSYMNLYLCDADPVDVAAGVQEHRPGWQSRGRGSPGGSSQPQFQSHYRAITPTQYDFQVERAPSGT